MSRKRDTEIAGALQEIQVRLLEVMWGEQGAYIEAVRVAARDIGELMGRLLRGEDITPDG